jgi:hypothetical protein
MQLHSFISGLHPFPAILLGLQLIHGRQEQAQAIRVATDGKQHSHQTPAQQGFNFGLPQRKFLMSLLRPQLLFRGLLDMLFQPTQLMVQMALMAQQVQ